MIFINFATIVGHLSVIGHIFRRGLAGSLGSLSDCFIKG